MTTQSETALAYFEALGAGEVDKAVSLLAADVDFRSPGGTMTGQDQAGPFLHGFDVAFPDATFEIDKVIESDEGVAVEGTYRGTHSGPLATPDGNEIPPSGKTASVPFVTLLTVDAGRISSHRAYWDQLTFMSQLGLMP
jgi:steroid delta-isomerase-like uncharacterized protein